VTHDTVWRFVRRAGLTVKKDADRLGAGPAGGGALPSPPAPGRPDRLVFVDETWIRTDMTRVRGWCPRGTPLLAGVPHGRWRTLTFVAGLRRGEVVAPCVVDGPINGRLFTTWVEQSLAPTLVLDNLGSHKGWRARQAIRAVGAHLLFLPPYSPDLNPIEMLFAKLKTLCRKADRRTVEEAWREVGRLLDHFRPDECEAYPRHPGYGAKTT
jgi:transposase